MASQRDVLPIIRDQFTALKHLDYAAQIDAIRALGEGKDPLDELLLLYLTDDHSQWIREEAVDTLLTRGGPLARIAARACLADAEWLVRDRATEALEEVGNRLDVYRLIQALHDSQWVVRASAATSLGAIGGQKAKQVLLSALTHETHPVVRRDVAGGLAKLGDRSVIPVLESVVVRETEASAKVGMLHALYLLGQTRYLGPWLLLLKDQDDSVRHSIVNSTDETAPEDREVVVEALQDMIACETNPGVKGDAERAMRVLLSQ